MAHVTLTRGNLGHRRLSLRPYLRPSLRDTLASSAQAPEAKKGARLALITIGAKPRAPGLCGQRRLLFRGKALNIGFLHSAPPVLKRWLRAKHAQLSMFTQTRVSAASNRHRAPMVQCQCQKLSLATKQNSAESKTLNRNWFVDAKSGSTQTPNIEVKTSPPRQPHVAHIMPWRHSVSCNKQTIQMVYINADLG